ncbi:unnamed protein product [Urochloa humidicola]
MEVELRRRQQAAQQVPVNGRRLRRGQGLLVARVDGWALERRHVGEELHLQLGLCSCCQAVVTMKRRSRSATAAAHVVVAAGHGGVAGRIAGGAVAGVSLLLVGHRLLEGAAHHPSFLLNNSYGCNQFEFRVSDIQSLLQVANNLNFYEFKR